MYPLPFVISVTALSNEGWVIMIIQFFFDSLFDGTDFLVIVFLPNYYLIWPLINIFRYKRKDFQSDGSNSY